MESQNQDIYRLVGSQIRSYRLSKHMSQSDLAEKSHISLSHISDIENGKTAIKLHTFVAIIDALHISADEILRSDTPYVRNTCNQKFMDLTQNCTTAEMDTLLQIISKIIEFPR